MGIDVQFTAELAELLTQDQIDALHGACIERFGSEWTNDRGETWPLIKQRQGYLYLSSLNRYYGPNYRRGFWPQIRLVGDWLMEALGGQATLYYGGDTGMSDVPWTKARVEYEVDWQQVGRDQQQGRWNA